MTKTKRMYRTLRLLYRTHIEQNISIYILHNRFQQIVHQINIKRIVLILWKMSFSYSFSSPLLLLRLATKNDFVKVLYYPPHESNGLFSWSFIFIFVQIYLKIVICMSFFINWKNKAVLRLIFRFIYLLIILVIS